MRYVDLGSILNDYVDWFNHVGPPTGRGSAKPLSVGFSRPAKDAPDITQIADVARDFLADRLPPDIPANFALSIIESLAYTVSRFASADQANAYLYRTAALRILEAGLPLQRN